MGVSGVSGEEGWEGAYTMVAGGAVGMGSSVARLMNVSACGVRCLMGCVSLSAMISLIKLVASPTGAFWVLNEVQCTVSQELCSYSQS